MYTRCEVVAAGNVTCKCAPDRFDTTYPDGKLVGGEKGYCACPPGQYVRDGRCFQCEIGTYRNSSTSQYDPCVHCSSMYTKTVGSTSEDNCTQNPIVLQNEISERDRQAQEQKKIYYISISCAVGVVGISIAFGCYTHNLRMKLKDQELDEEQAKVEEATREMTYYRDWRIRPEELQFEELVASGRCD